jgi:guanosine-3',5'-bis(diphosphate) 3'-pyrophosphohydrolase
MDKARAFALKAHGSQMYGNSPYIYHLEMVYGYTLQYGVQEGSPFPSALLEAAWLHDVLEDTPTTYDQIVEEFGTEVADLVQAVTSEPGKNRKARNQATYPKIRAAGIEAICLKLCDRLANGRHSFDTNPRMFEMYRKEYADFREALYIQHPLLDPLFERLDQLFEVTL